MRADQRVEEQIGPEAEDAEGVGVDRPAEQSRDPVVADAERQLSEPHAHRVVHVVALDDRVAEASLVPGQVARDVQDREAAERPEDVPVRDVDLGKRSRRRPCGTRRIRR